MEERHRALYICRKDCKAKADDRVIKQPVLIEKGDIIQFRYESPKHFRTINEEYFNVSKEVWEDCFVCIADIWKDIVWKNKATLKEILSLELYNQTREQKTVQKEYSLDTKKE